jgi:hypothetical protein
MLTDFKGFLASNQRLEPAGSDLWFEENYFFFAGFFAAFFMGFFVAAFLATVFLLLGAATVSFAATFVF